MESNGKLQFITVLRAMAISIVMYSHLFEIPFFWQKSFFQEINIMPFIHYTFSPFWASIIWFTNNIGQIGVGLFFLISGFVIPVSIEKYGSWGFLKKRLIRLYPTFITAIAIWYACTLAYCHFVDLAPSSFNLHFINLLLAPFGLPNYYILSHKILWTLIIEWQFYITLTLAFLMHKSHGKITQWHIFFCAGIMWSLLLIATVLKLRIFTQQFYILLIGTSYYLLSQNRITKTTFTMHFSTLLFITYIGKDVHYITQYGISIVIWHIFLSNKSRVKSPKWITFIANISYPLYLLHIMCYFSISYIVNQMHCNPIIGYAASIPALTMLCFFIHKYVEKKCINNF